MHTFIEQMLLTSVTINPSSIYLYTISNPLFLSAQFVTDFTTVTIQYGKRAGNIRIGFEGVA